MNQPADVGCDDSIVTRAEMMKDDMKSSSEDTYEDGVDTGMAG